MTPEQFKEWRSEMGWTQARAATELGINKRTVEMYEAGRRGDAKIRVVVIPRVIDLACAALAAGFSGYESSMAEPST